MSLINKYTIKCKTLSDPVLIRIPEKESDDWKIGTDFAAGVLAITYKNELIFFSQLSEVETFLKSYEMVAEETKKETDDADGE